MKKSMKNLLSCMLASSLAYGAAVHAHAHLHKSEPASGSTISVLPKNLVLEFSEAMQLTALSLHKGDAKVQDLGPLPTAASTKVSLPMPGLAAGSYIIQWRGVSKDEHVTSGSWCSPSRRLNSLCGLMSLQ
ncbi:MAG: copper resistance protein CopC [Polyangiaceae bacterium]